MCASLAELQVPVRAGALKKGDYVMLKDKPCKISSVTSVVTSKHGHAKAVLQGKCIFSGETAMGTCQTTHCIMQPVVTTSHWTVLMVEEEADDGVMTCSLINEAGETKEGLELDGEAGPMAEHHRQIVEGFEAGKSVQVKVVEAMEQECVYYVSSSEGEL